MDKRLHIRPYSFRNRMLAALFLCALAACLFSAIGSFVVSMANLGNEMAASEREAAVYLLGLEQKTTLDPAEMLAMARRENLSLSVVSNPSQHLTDGQLDSVMNGQVLTISTKALPSTYVLVDDQVVCIRTARDFNLYLSVFPRIGVALLLSLVLFLLLSVLTSAVISKPISEITRATRLIQEGDFTVRLTENRPGEVGELMHSFNGMTEALSRTAYLQKDFISSISHEFRTPIASIRGFARLLQMPGLDENARQEYVGMIAQESDRLSRLSDTLLRLSALERQLAPASLSVFRLDEQIRQVILQLEPAWSSRQIDWQLDLAPVTIESDAELLIQVWINLIQNAVKFSDDGGVIEIRVQETDMAEVIITDHGIGMSEETMARIFDRFYQGDTSRSREGVGLGLCLVKRIMDILGGEIRVRSARGQGSTFRARLPRMNKAD